MNTFSIVDSVLPPKEEVLLGDEIQLTNQTQKVVKCQESGVKMLNIDADQLALGDLKFIKKIGLTISNPETDKPIALGVEYKTFGRKLADWFDTEDTDDDDDDNSFFSSTPSSSGSLFGGSGGFGGFGGFGGGSFSGGGASRGF